MKIEELEEVKILVVKDRSQSQKQKNESSKEIVGHRSHFHSRRSSLLNIFACITGVLYLPLQMIVSRIQRSPLRSSRTELPYRLVAASEWTLRGGVAVQYEPGAS